MSKLNRAILSRSCTKILPLVFALMVIFLGGFHLRHGVEIMREKTENVREQSINADLIPKNTTAKIEQNRREGMPLGLQWFRQGFENPWQFSTLRTGIAELEEAYKRVLKRDGKLPRLVVSFTSLPNRFDKYAATTIRLLKEQKYPPDHIYVCIPAVSRRSNDSFRVPSWISKDKDITVLRSNVDYGPATKLIPAVRAEQELNNTRTRIVTIDDDNEGGWNDEQLRSLFLYSLVFEDSALGLTAWNVTCMTSDARCEEKDSGIRRRQSPNSLYNFVRPADDYACHSLADWMPSYYSYCIGAIRRNYVGFVDVIEGYKGALYQPRFFSLKDIESIISPSVPDSFFLCDDVWFSGWLSTKNIKRLIVNPALHDDALVNKLLERYNTKTRKVSREMKEPNQKDLEEIAKRRNATGNKVEDGLHSLGNFVKSNHDAVKWFEGKNAWTKDMWKRPSGFRYASEAASDNDNDNDDDEEDED